MLYVWIITIMVLTPDNPPYSFVYGAPTQTYNNEEWCETAKLSLSFQFSKTMPDTATIMGVCHKLDISGLTIRT
jgi:hypothetical protein